MHGVWLWQGIFNVGRGAFDQYDRRNKSGATAVREHVSRQSRRTMEPRPRGLASPEPVEPSPQFLLINREGMHPGNVVCQKAVGKGKCVQAAGHAVALLLNAQQLELEWRGVKVVMLNEEKTHGKLRGWSDRIVGAVGVGHQRVGHIQLALVSACKDPVARLVDDLKRVVLDKRKMVVRYHAVGQCTEHGGLDSCRTKASCQQGKPLQRNDL